MSSYENTWDQMWLNEVILDRLEKTIKDWFWSEKDKSKFLVVMNVVVVGVVVFGMEVGGEVMCSYNELRENGHLPESQKTQDKMRGIWSSLLLCPDGLRWGWGKDQPYCHGWPCLTTRKMPSESFMLLSLLEVCQEWRVLYGDNWRTLRVPD